MRGLLALRAVDPTPATAEAWEQVMEAAGEPLAVSLAFTAVAVIVTFDLRATVAPFAGFVIATAGAMLSPAAWKPILFTEPAPRAR